MASTGVYPRGRERSLRWGVCAGWNGARLFTVAHPLTAALNSVQMNPTKRQRYHSKAVGHSDLSTTNLHLYLGRRA